VAGVASLDEEDAERYRRHYSFEERFKRMLRRWRRVWKKHHAHREHRVSRRKP